MYPLILFEPIDNNGNAICPNGTLQDPQKYCHVNGRCLVVDSSKVSVPCTNEIDGKTECSEWYHPNHVCKGNNLCKS